MFPHCSLSVFIVFRQCLPIFPEFVWILSFVSQCSPMFSEYSAGDLYSAWYFLLSRYFLNVLLMFHLCTVLPISLIFSKYSISILITFYQFSMFRPCSIMFCESFSNEVHQVLTVFLILFPNIILSILSSILTLSLQDSPRPVSSRFSKNSFQVTLRSLRFFLNSTKQ